MTTVTKTKPAADLPHFCRALKGPQCWTRSKKGQNSGR